MRPAYRYALHLGLFLATLITTTLAGVQLVRSGPVDWLALDVVGLPARERLAQLGWGALYAGPFVGVLAVHEFGHYFVARTIRCAPRCRISCPCRLGWARLGRLSG